MWGHTKHLQTTLDDVVFPINGSGEGFEGVIDHPWQTITLIGAFRAFASISKSWRPLAPSSIQIAGICAGDRLQNNSVKIWLLLLILWWQRSGNTQRMFSA